MAGRDAVRPGEGKRDAVTPSAGAHAAAVAEAAPRLELRAITKDFPGVRALDGVSFELRAGEIHALCGENGAGKSTLIKILSGVHPAGTYGGEIRLDGRPVEFAGVRAAEAAGIALIAQEPALVPDLSVAENLVLGREPSRLGWIDRSAVDATARRALERVGLDVDPSRPVHELGIGGQQLVEIARALEKSASILILDEPTAALTVGDVARLRALLLDLRGRGVSAIYISHRLDEVFGLADRITVLRDGRTVQSGRADELTRERIISWMVGREVRDLYPRPALHPGATLLKVEGWTVEDPLNPGRTVLDGVDLEVRAGEIVGVAGLMGAGRTALLSSLFGAARSEVRGRLTLGEGPGAIARAPFASPAEAIAAGLALVSEDRKRYGLVPTASVLDNMTLATLRRFAPAGWLSRNATQAAAREQVAALRLKTAGLDVPVTQLSGGNQQKVILGRWLLAQPRLLLLDEPTRGVDVGARAEIYELIRALVERGMGVLLASSDLPEVLGLCHRILVLREGRRTAAWTSDEATAERVMAAAALGGGV
jgi:D-xylose transport system ATP-binding protein